MSTVWAVPPSVVRRSRILGFLRDARCSVRVVEVRLFKNDTLYKRTPVGSRCWEPSSDLTKTAQEITQYIADNGAVEATLVVADEVQALRPSERRRARINRRRLANTYQV